MAAPASSYPLFRERFLLQPLATTSANNSLPGDQGPATCPTLAPRDPALRSGSEGQQTAQL